MKALCLGINGTWRVGGADAGEAAGSVSEDRSLFGATDKEGGGSLTGCSGAQGSAGGRRVCSFMEWAI